MAARPPREPMKMSHLETTWEELEIGESGVQAKLETVTPSVPVTGLVSPPGTLGQSHLIQGRKYWGCVYVLKKIQGLMLVCLVILVI